MSNKIGFRFSPEIWQILDEVSVEYGRPNFPSLLHSEMMRMSKKINTDTDCDCDNNDKTMHTFLIPEAALPSIQCIARRLNMPESTVIASMIINPIFSDYFTKNGW